MPAKTAAERNAEIRTDHIANMTGNGSYYHVCYACWYDMGSPLYPRGQEEVLDFWPPHTETLKTMLRRVGWWVPYDIGQLIEDPRKRLLLCAEHRKAARLGWRPQTNYGLMYGPSDPDGEIEREGRAKRYEQEMRERLGENGGDS